MMHHYIPVYIYIPPEHNMPEVTIDKTVWVTFEREGIHCYPDAPKGVEFLKHPHRHIFHFRVEVQVHHNERDIEFILLKRELEGLYDKGTLELNSKSCETMAMELGEYMLNNYPGRHLAIDVNEDEENGATVRWQ